MRPPQKEFREPTAARAQHFGRSTHPPGTPRRGSWAIDPSGYGSAWTSHTNCWTVLRTDRRRFLQRAGLASTRRLRARRVEIVLAWAPEARQPEMRPAALQSLMGRRWRVSWTISPPNSA